MIALQLATLEDLHKTTGLFYENEHYTISYSGFFIYLMGKGEDRSSHLLTTAGVSTDQLPELIDIANQDIPEGKKIDRNVEPITEHIKAQADNWFISLRATKSKGYFLYFPLENKEINIGQVSPIAAIQAYNRTVLAQFIGEK
jgi:hypothetical protein